MATSARPFIVTGVALASVAAIATAAPAALPGVPSPLKLSTAQYDLTALSDITIQGITDAVTTGWGGFIGPTDTFYPGEFNNDVKLTGVNGAAYYVLDNALNGLAPFNLENYFFEVGSKGANLLTSGLGAVAYVGSGSVFGLDSPVTQVVKNFVTGGPTGGVDISAAVLSLTAGIPVVGDLASVYFTGQVAGDTTDYGKGFAGVLAYASKLLPGLGNLPNLNLNGLIAGITGFVGGVASVIGGRGWSHHAEDEGEDDSHDYDHEDGEDGDHHHSHSAASVVSRAVAAVTVAAPLTAVKPAAAVAKAPSAAAVAKDAKAPEAVEVEAPKTPEVNEAPEAPEANEANEAPEASETAEAPKAPKAEAPATAPAVVAPKRAASRAQAAPGGSARTAAHPVKRGKVDRAS